MVVPSISSRSLTAMFRFGVTSGALSQEITASMCTSSAIFARDVPQLADTGTLMALNMVPMTTMCITNMLVTLQWLLLTKMAMLASKSPTHHSACSDQSLSSVDHSSCTRRWMISAAEVTRPLNPTVILALALPAARSA